MKSIVNGVITYYPGRHYNKTVDGVNDKVEKYYVFASLMVAMRVIENGTDTLQWLLADHLGSTSVTANIDGSLNSILKYSAFGEIWASSGVTNTDYLYTGQLSQAEIGLYYYNARWYDPALGRFIQADTIVPGAGNASAYDRYAYVLNNPINYNDPSGHDYSRGCSILIDGETCSPDYGKRINNYDNQNTSDDYWTINKIVDISKKGSIFIAEGTYGLDYFEDDLSLPIYSSDPLVISIGLIDLGVRILNPYFNQNSSSISNQSIEYYIYALQTNISESSLGKYKFVYLYLTNNSNHDIYIVNTNFLAPIVSSTKNISIPIEQNIGPSDHIIVPLVDENGDPLTLNADLFQSVKMTISTICYRCIYLNGSWQKWQFSGEIFFP